MQRSGTDARPCVPAQDHYEVAIRLAKEQLQQADVHERCAKSGATYRSGDRLIEVPFAGRTVRLTWPALDFVDGLEVWEQILLLHYLNTATGAPLSERWVTFDQVPGGMFYLPAFRRRSVDRLVAAFGDGEALVEAARRLGGSPAGYGDVGVVVPVFPRVAVMLVVWRGDEEIAPSGNILFDAGIGDYLPTEDIVWSPGCSWAG